MFLSKSHFIISCLFLLSSCSGANFGASSTASPNSGAATNTTKTGTPGAPGTSGSNATATQGILTANFTLTAGSQSLKISGQFQPANKAQSGTQDVKGDYVWVPSSAVNVPMGGFPADLAQKLAASTFTATIKASSSVPNGLQLDMTMATHGLVANGQNVADQSIPLTQTSVKPQWTKDEGAIGALAALGSASSTNPVDCKILPSGKQASHGVYAVILTQPAPCDFKMPTVKIGWSLHNITVPTGTYWREGEVAHTFPLGPMPRGPNWTMGNIDNGFIMIQPDGKSYLLADAGRAFPTRADYRSAETIANDVSQTLGFGATKLLQPDPNGTIFKKGRFRLASG